jgi:hypothetical protein
MKLVPVVYLDFYHHFYLIPLFCLQDGGAEG